MAEATIRTPGTVTVRQNGVTVEIEWEPDFGRRWNEQYKKAQFLFDEEVLRLMTPYVPVDTTMLRGIMTPPIPAAMHRLPAATGGNGARRTTLPTLKALQERL